MAYAIARNLLFDGEPCNIHPFTTMDDDCSPEGIAALAFGTGMVLSQDEIEPYLTDKSGFAMGIRTPYAVVEAITPKRTKPHASG